MTAQLGSTNLKKLYMGSTAIKKIYLGSTLVFQESIAPATVYVDSVTQYTGVIPNGQSYVDVPLGFTVNPEMFWISKGGQTTNSGAGNTNRDIKFFILGTNDTVRVQRKGTATTLTFSFQIVIPNANLVANVQHRDLLGLTSGTVSTTGDLFYYFAELDRSITINQGWNNSIENSASDFAKSGFVACWLANRGQIGIAQYSAASGNTEISVAVVQFKTTAIVRVIPIIGETFTGTGLTDVITLSTPVDTGKLGDCIYVNTGTLQSLTSAYGASFFTGELTSETEVTMTRITGTTSTRKHYGYVVQFVPGVLKSVQRGTISHQGGTGVVNLTKDVTAVNRAKTMMTTNGRRTSLASSASAGWPYMTFLDDDTIQTNSNSATGAGTFLAEYELAEFN